jgi:hypothetical protein
VTVIKCKGTAQGGPSRRGDGSQESDDFARRSLTYLTPDYICGRSYCSDSTPPLKSRHWNSCHQHPIPYSSMSSMRFFTLQQQHCKMRATELNAKGKPLFQLALHYTWRRLFCFIMSSLPSRVFSRTGIQCTSLISDLGTCVFSRLYHEDDQKVSTFGPKTLSPALPNLRFHGSCDCSSNV